MMNSSFWDRLTKILKLEEEKPEENMKASFFAGLQYAANVILTVQKLGFVLAIMELAPVCNCVNPVRARL